MPRLIVSNVLNLLCIILGLIHERDEYTAKMLVVSFDPTRLASRIGRDKMLWYQELRAVVYSKTSMRLGGWNWARRLYLEKSGYRDFEYYMTSW